MKFVIKLDLVSGVFFFILSVLLVILIPSQIKVLGDSHITARSFPYLLSFLIMVMSLRLIITDLFKIIRKQKINTKKFDLKVEMKALIIFGILIGYLILMPFTGFLISSLLMCVSFLFFFRTKRKIYYLIVVVACVIVFYIFRFGLNVQLL